MSDTSPKNPQKQQPSLKIREWLAVFILVGLISFLAIITTFKSSQKSSHSESLSYREKISMNHHFDVVVKGAVGNPGVYHLSSSISMRDLLAIAQVNEDADLRRYNIDQVIQRGRIVNVPSRGVLTVHLTGAVKNPGVIQMPKGSSMQDLLAVVELEDQADRKFLEKKRKLKADEIIDVPYKVAKKQKIAK